MTNTADFDFDTIMSKLIPEETPVLIGNVLYVAKYTSREERWIFGYTAGKVFELLKLKDGSTHRAYTYHARPYTGIFLQYIDTYIGKEDQRDLFLALTKCHVVAHKNKAALNAVLAHKIAQKFPRRYTRSSLLEAYVRSRQWASYGLGGLSYYDGKNVIVYKDLKALLNDKKKRLPANEIDGSLLARAKDRYLLLGYATLEVKILSLRAYSTMKVLKTLHDEVTSCMLSGKKYARYATIWRNFYYRNAFSVAIFYYDQKPVGRMLVYDREGVKAFIDKTYGECRPALLTALGYKGECFLQGQEARFKRLDGIYAVAPYSDPMRGIFSCTGMDTKRFHARWGSNQGDFDFEARSVEGRITITAYKCCTCDSSLEYDHIQPSEQGDVYCTDCYHEYFIVCPVCEAEVPIEDAISTAILYSNGRYDIVPCCQRCAEGGSSRHTALPAIQYNNALGDVYCEAEVYIDSWGL